MTLSNYRIKVQQGNTIYSCDLYTTPQEARSVAQSDHPRVCVNIGGTNYYCGTASDSSADIPREQAPIAVYYDSAIPRLYRLAQKSFFTIGITASANQTITVTASNKPLGESGTGSYSFTSGTKYFPYGTTWSASLSADTGWTKGTLKNGSTNITEGTSYTLTNANATVTATAASLKTYTLTLAATSNETIKIRYKARNADGTMPSSWSSEISSGSSAKTYTLRHGSQYQITAFSASTGYNTGTLKNGSTAVSASTSTTYTLTGNITVSATAASLKTYTLTKSSTNASTNQTLTVKYLARNADGTYPSSWSTLSSGSVTLRHGSRWQGTVTANTGYNAGTVTNPGGTNSSMTGNVTVSVSAATAKNYTLKVKSTAVKVNGTARADEWSGSFAYNQQIKISNSQNCDTFVVTVWKNLNGSGTVWKESNKINSGSYYSFNMPDSNVSVRVTLYHEGGGGS